MINYSRGFDRLRTCLQDNAPTLVATLATLEDSFSRNQEREKLSGVTQETKADHARIINELNQLAIQNCNTSFNDLCNGASKPSSPFQIFPSWRERISTPRWKIVGILILFVILCILAPLCLFWVKATSCFTPTSDFDFESETSEGWAIRKEGENLLGVEAIPDNRYSCFRGNWSLRFSFDLRETPFEKAQVKYETPNLQLKSQLSGRIYVPVDAPTDLRVSCFTLEDNRRNRWPGKPEWPWYQTDYYPLTSNQWNNIHCPLADFSPAYPYPVGHIDEPLLVGFEITRQSRLPFQGVVYLDNISLR